MFWMARIKSAIGCGWCRCLKQDGQDYQDGQDKERPRCGWCRCLKQDGQDAQDGQDKEGFCSRLMSPLLRTS